ncbi:YlaF family protein [Litchfieldia alkalitelluris]|uniref:YlaF family protein n=1 Tax=Litchfieldia alkalitelluris TaxID=304268 RepID=UPI000996516F|nr:YlaF family protein [Litchfieldia alkalitelluris]
MKSINITMLIFSLLTVICMMSIGIAIAERSILGTILSILAVIIVMGFGFVTKKKMREKSNL